MRSWLRLTALTSTALAFMFVASCSQSSPESDAGLPDAEDGADLEPCVAAEPLWNDIWHTQMLNVPVPDGTPDNNVMDVWGSGPDDIYAVGFAGTILHYDGSSWTSMESGTEADLEGVWGYVLKDETGMVTRTDVFAVGSEGTVLRYDGTAWSPQLVINDPDINNPDPQPVTGYLHDVWGIAANGIGPDDHPYVVAVGGEGLIVRFDGVTNRFLEMRSREEFVDSQGVTRYSYIRWVSVKLAGLFGAGSLSDPLFVAVGDNGAILELSGDTWNRSQNFSPPGAFITDLGGVWGRGSWEIFATGIDGVVLRRDNGGVWHILAKENSLWDLSAVNLRGYWGFAQTYCGELPEVPEGEDPPENPVRENTSWVIFVGWGGTVLMGHDGLICEFAVPTKNRLEGIWGLSPRSEDERFVEDQTTNGGYECDSVEVLITGVNGTMIRLSNPEGR